MTTTAVVASSPPPPPAPAPAGMFSFLKHGVTIPARRPGLFFGVFALHAALSTALSLFNNLAGRLVVAAAMKPQSSETNIISTTKDADADIVAWLTVYAATTAAYAVLYLSVSLLKKVATASAAVAAYGSGEPPHQNHHHTLGFGSSFLGKVRRVSGTVALGAVLRTACAAAVAAAVVGMPALVLWGYSVEVLLLDAALAVIALLFYLYLDVVCAMAVVASVAEAEAEPGRRRGALGAVGQAWRAMAAGTRGRVVVYAVVTMALSVAVRSVSNVAVSWMLPRGMEVSSVVEGGVQYVLGFAVEVFSVAAVTAYYFECCRKTEEGKAGGHVHTD